jgi:hypothetical protein
VRGVTPLHLVAHCGKLEAMLLVKLSAVAEASTAAGSTPLLLAVRVQRRAKVRGEAFSRSFSHFKNRKTLWPPPSSP